MSGTPGKTASFPNVSTSFLLFPHPESAFLPICAPIRPPSRSFDPRSFITMKATFFATLTAAAVAAVSAIQAEPQPVEIEIVDAGRCFNEVKGSGCCNTAAT